MVSKAAVQLQHLVVAEKVFNIITFMKEKKTCYI